MSPKVLIAGVLGIVMLGAAGAAGWWLSRQHEAPRAVAAPRSAPVFDTKEYRYVSLDKVIVMLKADAAKADSRFLAMDLVLRSDKQHEPAVKSDLPMLRSVVVKTVSRYSATEATDSGIEALTSAINKELAAAYDGGDRERPFSEAMIAKLVIE